MFTNSSSTKPPPFRLERDRWQRLHLTFADGTRFENVRPIRLFPFSDRSGWISLRDGGGQEIMLVERFSDLPEDAQTLLAAELGQHEFVPVIERIVQKLGDLNPSEWVVETDRGTTRFVLKSDDDIRRLDGQRALITDAFGVRYLIPNLSALDAASRRIMEQFV